MGPIKPTAKKMIDLALEMGSAHDGIDAAYIATKEACAKGYRLKTTGAAIKHLAEISSKFLAEECNLVNLMSRVPGKDYISFAHKKGSRKVARPANRQFFIQDPAVVARYWNSWENNKISQTDFAKFSYTVALAPCLAMELFDRNNKKGPATYFECLIGHMFARELGIDPHKRASIKVQGKNVLLTMDFLFTGSKGQQVHLPVKMSTRERVIQAWAHQRILDGSHGENAYRGIMVLFSETKLNSHSHEVVEICVPDQWLAYQTLLSKIERIYYFDMPSRYQELTDKYPDVIKIKQFGEFFTERATLFGASQ